MIVFVMTPMTISTMAAVVAATTATILLPFQLTMPLTSYKQVRLLRTISPFPRKLFKICRCQAKIL